VWVCVQGQVVVVAAGEVEEKARVTLASQQANTYLWKKQHQTAKPVFNE
jgi:hypothetical protein